MWKRILRGAGWLVVLFLIVVGILWLGIVLAGWIQGPVGPLIEP